MAKGCVCALLLLASASLCLFAGVVLGMFLPLFELRAEAARACTITGPALARPCGTTAYSVTFEGSTGAGVGLACTSPDARIGALCWEGGDKRGSGPLGRRRTTFQSARWTHGLLRVCVFDRDHRAGQLRQPAEVPLLGQRAAAAVLVRGVTPAPCALVRGRLSTLISHPLPLHGPLSPGARRARAPRARIPGLKVKPFRPAAWW